MDRLARDAGRLIREIRLAGCETITKKDGSPVTVADQRAEALILAGLRVLAPETPIVSEEATEAGAKVQCGDRFFLVDPLDGTRGFTEGGAEYTVNIALIEDGAPVLGVVYAPATGALYLGGPDGALSARCDKSTAKPTAPLRRIQVTADPADLRGIKSRTSDGVEPFLKRAGAKAVIAASSSVKFCMIAAGEADLYPRFGPVSEWDAAAGDAVLRAAGGGVMNLKGAPLVYCGQTGEAALVRGFVAYGGAKAEAAARAALA